MNSNDDLIKLKTMKGILIFLAIFGLISTILPFIKNDIWWIRMFDFPFVQVTLILAIAFVGLLFYWDSIEIWENILLALLFVAFVYKAFIIFPYTILSSPQVLSSNKTDEGNTISILSSNVLMTNRNSSKLLSVIKDKNPDILLLLEIDQWWLDEFSTLKKNYPYTVEIPLDNKYGMVLMSKLKLIEPNIHYFMNPEIPSIQSLIELRSGKKIQLYSVHPMPPSPTENKKSTERDAELLLVGKKVVNDKLPTIVAGDLNDVAWSSTTRLFQKISQLLDPRIGRGFYNTFHAQNILIRWPLDHVFCSDDFKLVNLERLPDIDSDHFPIYVKLHFEPVAAVQQEEPKADQEDKKRAEEKIENGKKE